MDLVCKDVNQSGTGSGTTLALNGLQIAGSAKAGDRYGISLKLSDALGAYVTHMQDVGAIKPEPPQITSLSIPGALQAGQSFRLRARGTDPDGNDNKLRWNFGGNPGGGLSRVRKSTGGSVSADYWNNRSWGRHTIAVRVTDEQGLTASRSTSYQAWQEQSSGGSNSDPLVFDLNNDGEIGITGAASPAMRAVYRLVYGISKLPRFRKTIGMSSPMPIPATDTTNLPYRSTRPVVGRLVLSRWTKMVDGTHLIFSAKFNGETGTLSAGGMTSI